MPAGVCEVHPAGQGPMCHVSRSEQLVQQVQVASALAVERVLHSTSTLRTYVRSQGSVSACLCALRCMAQVRLASEAPQGHHTGVTSPDCVAMSWAGAPCMSPCHCEGPGASRHLQSGDRLCS